MRSQQIVVAYWLAWPTDFGVGPTLQAGTGIAPSKKPKDAAPSRVVSFSFLWFFVAGGHLVAFSP